MLIRKPSWLPLPKIENANPTNNPIHNPETAPAAATLARVIRPVTRSTVLSSVPTIAMFWTSNSLSDRKSTTFWACS